MRIAEADTIDADVLARIIARVEDSLRLQGFDVPPAKKAVHYENSEFGLRWPIKRGSQSIL